MALTRSDPWAAPVERQAPADPILWGELVVGSCLVFGAHAAVVGGLSLAALLNDLPPNHLLVPFVLGIGVVQMVYLAPLTGLVSWVRGPMGRRAMFQGVTLGAVGTFVVNTLGLLASLTG